MGLFDTLFGKSAQTEKLPTMSSEQQQMFSQLIQMLTGGEGGEGGMEQAFAQLMQMLDPSSEAMQRFADPFMKQFEQETIPGLAERFAGGAQGGALSSSGFGQALSSAGAGLQTDLAGMKSQLQQSALQDLIGLMDKGLSKDTFAYQHTPASQGLVQSGLSTFAGAGAPSLSGFSNLFSKKQ